MQGFDYAKQHMGQQGEDGGLTVTKETLVLSLPVRDAPLTQALQDGKALKRTQSTEKHLRWVLWKWNKEPRLFLDGPSGIR